MISTSTAEDLLEQARGLHRSTRALLRTPPSGRAGAAAEAVLGVLAEAGEVRPGSLVCRLGTSASVLSRQLGELEDSGLVDRRPDPQDGRAHLVQVSREGERLLAGTAGARVERLRRVLDGWSEEEARDALRALARLRRALEADGPGRALDPGPDDLRRTPVTSGRRRPAVHHPDHPTTAATGPAAARAEQEVGA